MTQEGFVPFNDDKPKDVENIYLEDNTPANSMPFRPIDKSVVSQNPPDFS